MDYKVTFVMLLLGLHITSCLRSQSFGGRILD